jgi:hypothetical protein
MHTNRPQDSRSFSERLQNNCRDPFGEIKQRFVQQLITININRVQSSSSEKIAQYIFLICSLNMV